MKHKVRVARLSNSRSTCARSHPCARIQGLAQASGPEWSFSLPSTSSSTLSLAQAAISDFCVHHTSSPKITPGPRDGEPLLGSGMTRFWGAFTSKPVLFAVRNLVYRSLLKLCSAFCSMTESVAHLMSIFRDWFGLYPVRNPPWSIVHVIGLSWQRDL